MKCLDDETAAALISGALDDASADVARQHVVDCDVCRRLLADGIRAHSSIIGRASADLTTTSAEPATLTKQSAPNHVDDSRTTNKPNKAGKLAQTLESRSRPKGVVAQQRMPSMLTLPAVTLRSDTDSPAPPGEEQRTVKMPDLQAAELGDDEETQAQEKAPQQQKQQQSTEKLAPLPPPPPIQTLTEPLPHLQQRRQPSSSSSLLSSEPQNVLQERRRDFSRAPLPIPNPSSRAPQQATTPSSTSSTLILIVVAVVMALVGLGLLSLFHAK